MNSILTFYVKSETSCTLEQFLRQEQGVSKRLITKLKRTNGLFCNDKPIRSIDPVKFGDIVTLHLSDNSVALPSIETTVPVVLETSQFLIYNKPPDMPVHPSRNHYTDTLGNVFSSSFPELPFRSVNRLDKNTSGLCVVAKNAHAVHILQKSMQKQYYAIVQGKILKSGTVNAPIAREHESIIKRCVRDDGKYAVTHYTPIYNTETYTLVKIKLETGRTHQIRVHMSYIGYPLAGDEMYGGDCTHISRHALHCTRVFLPALENNTSWITVSSELPDDMKKLINLA